MTMSWLAHNRLVHQVCLIVALSERTYSRPTLSTARTFETKLVEPHLGNRGDRSKVRITWLV
jgi:hypothetical protein